jgi:hypothetical protein
MIGKKKTEISILQYCSPAKALFFLPHAFKGALFQYLPNIPKLSTLLRFDRHVMLLFFPIAHKKKWLPSEGRVTAVEVLPSERRRMRTVKI